MSEIITRVSTRVGLPEWWVESVAIEYLDCRAFASTGALSQFQFDRLTDDELADAVTRRHVVMRGYLLHNVWPEFLSGNTVRTVVGSYAELPAQGPGDIVPEGRASEHCFMFAGNDISVEDPKLAVPLGFFQVRDDGAFWQWQFIPLESRAERQSGIVDLGPLGEIERACKQLQAQWHRRSPADSSDLLAQVSHLYERAERARAEVRETLWQYHLKMKTTAGTDKVVKGLPPMLSFMETIRVRAGEIETQFAAEPIFYRACLSFVAEARTCTQLDVLHEKRAGAVILAAACLEAYINRVLDLTHPDLFRSIERLPLPSKWHLLLTMHNRATAWDVDSEPIKTLKHIQTSRNALMHFKRGFRQVVRKAPATLSHLDGVVLDEDLVFSLPHRLKELVVLASSVRGVDPPNWLEPSAAWRLPPETSDARPSIRRVGTMPRRAMVMRVSGSISVGKPRPDQRRQPARDQHVSPTGGTAQSFLPPDANVLVSYLEALHGEFADAGLSWDGRDGSAWKKRVFSCFEKLAGGQYTVNFSLKDVKTEWVNDLTWTRGAVVAADFEGVELALECEWGLGVSQWKWLDKVLEDLHKLLVVRAPVKVFIYGPPMLENCGTPAERLAPVKDAVAKLATEDENYLVVLFMPPAPSDLDRMSCILHGATYQCETWTEIPAKPVPLPTKGDGLS